MGVGGRGGRGRRGRGGRASTCPPARACANRASASANSPSARRTISRCPASADFIHFPPHPPRTACSPCARMSAIRRVGFWNLYKHPSRPRARQPADESTCSRMNNPVPSRLPDLVGRMARNLWEASGRASKDVRVSRLSQILHSFHGIHDDCWRPKNYG